MKDEQKEILPSVNRFQSILSEEKPHSSGRLNRLIPFFLSFLLLLAVLPMFYYPDHTLSTWLSSPLVRDIYWAVAAFLCIVFACVVWGKNQAKIPLRYGLMFVWVALFTLIVAFIHENALAYVDSGGATQIFTLPLFERLFYEAKTFYAIAFSFAFLFLWSYAKEDPKYKNLVLYLVILLALASVIYAFIKGPDTAEGYLVYTSFFKSNEDLGKVLFAGTFASAVLAYDHQDWRRYVFTGVSMAFVALTGVLALAITFWGLMIASFVAGISVLLDRRAKSKALKIACLVYVLAIVVFILLVAVPSSLADTLRIYFANEAAALLSERLALWGQYLDSLSSWRIFIGAGAMGYYRVSLLYGHEPALMSLQNGVLDVYNDGGLVYLMFYFLLIIVGIYRFKKREEKNSSFFAIVLAFTCAFLFLTFISDERLFFSSHFLSFFVAYIFLCYPGQKSSPVAQGEAA
jgi:hypothetical protein